MGTLLSWKSKGQIDETFHPHDCEMNSRITFDKLASNVLPFTLGGDWFLLFIQILNYGSFSYNFRWI